MLVATNKTALMGILNHIKPTSTVRTRRSTTTRSPPRCTRCTSTSSGSGLSAAASSAGSSRPRTWTRTVTTATLGWRQQADGIRTGPAQRFRLRPNGATSAPLRTRCGNNHVIFIINNAQGLIPTGSQTLSIGERGRSTGPAVAKASPMYSWTDEWARFLYQNGITVHILDAYNAQHNKSHSAVLRSAATAAGGKYFAVKNQAEIEIGLRENPRADPARKTPTSPRPAFRSARPTGRRA